MSNPIANNIFSSPQQGSSSPRQGPTTPPPPGSFPVGGQRSPVRSASPPKSLSPPAFTLPPSSSVAESKSRSPSPYNIPTQLSGYSNSPSRSIFTPRKLASSVPTEGVPALMEENSALKRDKTELGIMIADVHQHLKQIEALASYYYHDAIKSEQSRLVAYERFKTKSSSEDPFRSTIKQIDIVNKYVNKLLRHVNASVKKESTRSGNTKISYIITDQLKELLLNANYGSTLASVVSSVFMSDAYIKLGGYEAAQNLYRINCSTSEGQEQFVKSFMFYLYALNGQQVDYATLDTAQCIASIKQVAAQFGFEGLDFDLDSLSVNKQLSEIFGLHGVINNDIFMSAMSVMVSVGNLTSPINARRYTVNEVINKAYGATSSSLMYLGKNLNTLIDEKIPADRLGNYCKNESELKNLQENLSLGGFTTLERLASKAIKITFNKEKVQVAAYSVAQTQTQVNNQIFYDGPGILTTANLMIISMHKIPAGIVKAFFPEMSQMIDSLMEKSRPSDDILVKDEPLVYRTGEPVFDHTGRQRVAKAGTRRRQMTVHEESLDRIHVLMATIKNGIAEIEKPAKVEKAKQAKKAKSEAEKLAKRTAVPAF